MWLGALFLTVAEAPIGVAMLTQPVQWILRSYQDYVLLGTSLLILGSVLIVVGCDVALAVDAYALRGNRGAVQPSRRNWDWIVWISAFFLSVWLLKWSVLVALAYRRNGRLDILLLYLGLGLIVAGFDAALAIEAMRSRRPQWMAPGSGDNRMSL